MATLSIDEFMTQMAQFANKEMLSPGEALQLSLKIAELVLDNSVDISVLKLMSRFLTQSSYDELVEERNIEHQCGYPLCDKSPQQRVRRKLLLNGMVETSTRYQIWNRKPSMILPTTYLSQYCCKVHYQASMFYRNQLSTESLFTRKDILVVPPFQIHGYENAISTLEEVLQKHQELKDHGKSLSDVIAMMNGLNMGDEGESKDTHELVKLIEDFGIVENEGGLNGDEDNDNRNDHPRTDNAQASRAVEGYITTDHSFGGYVI